MIMNQHMNVFVECIEIYNFHFALLSSIDKTLSVHKRVYLNRTKSISNMSCFA